MIFNIPLRFRARDFPISSTGQGVEADDVQWRLRVVLSAQLNSESLQMLRYSGSNEDGQINLLHAVECYQSYVTYVSLTCLKISNKQFTKNPT